MKRLFSAAIILAMSALFFANCATKKDKVERTRVIAHRGYWDCEGSAKNSIKALEMSAEIGAWGSEFDVHLTADSVLIVYHNGEIDGIPIKTSNYADIKDVKLSNGESLPTLEAFLLKATELKGLQLIFELKPQGDKERNWLAAERSVEMINAFGLDNRTEYISFDIEACLAFKHYAPKAHVVSLSSVKTPKEVKELGLDGYDYHYSLLQKNPTWAQEAIELGLTSNVWTVNTTELMKEMLDLKVNYITSDKPVELLKMIGE